MLKKNWFWVLLTVGLIGLNYGYDVHKNSVPSVSYTEFEKTLKESKVESMVIHNDYTRANKIIYYRIEDKSLPVNERKKYQVLVPSFQYFWQEFNKSPDYNKVEIKMEKIPEPSLLYSIFTASLPILLLFFLFVLLQKHTMKNMGGVLGKDSYEKVEPDNINIDFSDVIGIDEIKEEVSEIVDFLKHPEKFEEVGATMPKGMILYGEPGTGKTMLAKALAKEANVPFYATSGSNFVQMFVGMGAARVRQIFEEANKNAPCIIFIDEIDTIGGKRDNEFGGGGHEERNSTLNELLAQMDGITSNKGVLVLGATNRLNSLDSALTRAGRFDRKLGVPQIRYEGRLRLLKQLVERKKYNIHDDLNLEDCAKSLNGFSPAEITNLMNEAAIYQARKGKKQLDKACFYEALDKVVIGVSNGIKQSEEDKRVTAYHEAGHAVAGLFLPEADNVLKVSVESRGQALGTTMTIPDNDPHTYSETYLNTRLSILYGGLVAEELFTKTKSSGASNDIEVASNIVNNMIKKFGFSKTLPPYMIDNRVQMSESLLKTIENEMFSILEKQKNITKDILTEHQQIVHDMANMMMEKETIDKHDILNILIKNNIPKEKMPKYLQRLHDSQS